MRYIHLYFTCMKRALISRLEYKKDSIISIISFFISNICSILSIYFILNSIPKLEGWSMAEIGFLYGFSMLPVAVDHCFSDDLWLVAFYKVKEGKMDHMFLRPVPVLFQVLSETFQIEALGELIVGVIMIAICGSIVQVEWSFGLFVMLCIATIFGALIITALKIIVASLAFIFKRSGPLLSIIYGFITYTRYPLKIYPKMIQTVLMFVFPFALIIYFPIEVLIFNSYSPYLISLLIILVSIIFFTLSIIIWNLNIRKYESSGS